MFKRTEKELKSTLLFVKQVTEINNIDIFYFCKTFNQNEMSLSSKPSLGEMT